MKTMPSWITARCVVGTPKSEYDTNHATDKPYIIIGDSGFDVNSHAVITGAYAAADAHAAAVAALADPTIWGKAAAKFEALEACTVVPTETTGSMTSGPNLNVLALLDEHEKIGIACRVAEMYHDKTTHENAALLKTMATLSQQCVPRNVIDHTSIVSQHAIVTCTASLEAASASIASMDPSKPLLAATEFQHHVAAAEVAYGVAHPSVVPEELKTAFASAKKRITQNYSATYPSILKSTADAYVPVGSS